MTEKESLEHIHSVLTPVLRDTIRVLDGNGLPYMMIAGTLLGAVRHGGFIPWDDDIDLLMPRSSLDAFIKLYPEQCDEKYMLDLDETWVPRTRDKSDPEAFVDLFTIDPMPENKLARAIKVLRLRILQGMLKENVDYTRFSFTKRCMLRATHILGLLIPKKAKIERYHKIARATKPTSRYIHMSNVSFESISLTYDKDAFTELIRLPFEGMSVSAPKNYDLMLTSLYGSDYMTPPPESERHPTHIREA